MPVTLALCAQPVPGSSAEAIAAAVMKTQYFLASCRTDICIVFGPGGAVMRSAPVAIHPARDRVPRWANGE
ncbi:MAG: hypothetical protein ACR2F9_09975 [Longimicrobiaceae bacterium]